MLVGVAYSFRVIAIAALVLVATSLGFRKITTTFQDKERTRHAAGIVEAQWSELRELQPETGSKLSMGGWPDDFLSLQAWLIAETLKSGNPKFVLDELRTMRRQASYSSRMKMALDRWERTLLHWSETVSVRKSPQELLDEGRRHFFEAAGYQRIGRSYDATVLFLWSFDQLSTFIRRDPSSPDFAEALFLLGSGMLRVRHAFPKAVKSDRILTLCWELYPESVWGIRANAVWRDEFRNGV